MPYRVDIPHPAPEALDILVELGALDLEPIGDGLAAILPDSVAADVLAARLGLPSIDVSPATARDSGSVWLLNPRTVRIGNIVIAPPEGWAPPNALRLADSAAFGTGHHPTTALSIEAIAEIVSAGPVESLLDVGTGSGILALAALQLGVRRALGIDIDSQALDVATQNARLNGLSTRFLTAVGGPGAVEGAWPLVVANILAAPLIELAPTLVRRVASRGWLVLSGIPSALEPEVRHAYCHLGMRHSVSHARAGWTAIVFQASW